MKPLPSHLGGHHNKTHLDTASLEYMVNKYGIKTAYDVGCGPGGMVEEMIKLGVDAIGIDGDFTLNRSIQCIIHDFTIGPLNVVRRDFTWSVEFLEHVEERYSPNYFSVFKQCKWILCTASDVESAKHVNVQKVPYWIDLFEKNGFEFLQDDTDKIREISSMDRSFIRTTGMVFKNKEL